MLDPSPAHLSPCPLMQSYFLLKVREGKTVHQFHTFKFPSYLSVHPVFAIGSTIVIPTPIYTPDLTFGYPAYFTGERLELWSFDWPWAGISPLQQGAWARGWQDSLAPMPSYSLWASLLTTGLSGSLMFRVHLDQSKKVACGNRNITSSGKTSGGQSGTSGPEVKSEQEFQDGSRGACNPVDLLSVGSW